MEKSRCFWAKAGNENDDKLYKNYHDFEWGEPCFDDQKLFEMLILECFSAGLAWLIVLKKRENFRASFDNFDPKKIALYNETKISNLMKNPGIIRSLPKIKAAISNAKAFLEIQREFGSFAKFLWDFVDNEPVISNFSGANMPSKTPLSDKISKILKNRGFKFTGSVTIYAFLQAAGLVNDHSRECFKFAGTNKLTQI